MARSSQNAPAMTSLRLVTLTTTLTLGLMACTDGDSTGASELERQIAASQNDCGELVFDNAGCPSAAAALACFETSTQPRVVQVVTTIEGDPIYEHFFMDAGQIIAIRDTRADDWGPKTVTSQTCGALSLSGAADTCQLLRCDP